MGNKQSVPDTETPSGPTPPDIRDIASTSTVLVPDDDGDLENTLSLLTELMNLVRSRAKMHAVHSAISLLQDAIENPRYVGESRLIIQLNLVTAMLTRFGVHGWITDLDACYWASPDPWIAAPMFWKRQLTNDLTVVDKAQLAIQLTQECRDSLDVETLDTIIRTAEAIPTIDKASYLMDAEIRLILGNSLVMKYLCQGGAATLDEAAMRFQEAKHLCGSHAPFGYISFRSLEYIGWLRFTECCKIEGLSQISEYSQMATAMDKGVHHMLKMGIALAERAANETPSRIDEAVEILNSALSYYTHPHPKRPFSLNNLGFALHIRFKQKGTLQDLEACIKLHREALDLRPASHPDRSRSLNNLANTLLSLYQEKGTSDDLDECIVVYREALSLRPGQHPGRSTSLNNLAGALFMRFGQKGLFQDLDELILLRREALGLLSTTHPHRATFRGNLADALSTRLKQTNMLHDLEECISLHKEALALLPTSHSDRPDSLGTLANELYMLFQQTGTGSVLEECIELHREALSLRPAPNPERSVSLNNLAVALSVRFDQKGIFQDLDECIGLDREALGLKPVSFPSLNNLALSLFTRFQQKGVLQDLEECISLHRKARSLLSSSHPDYSLSSNNLANALAVQFSQKGILRDLEECIMLHYEALTLLPSPHPDRSMSLGNLATALSARFKQKGILKDLEECIRLNREALWLSPTRHPRRPTSLVNLANALSTSFKQKGELEDLEESIRLHREVLNMLPPLHRDRFECLVNLGNALTSRNDKFEDLREGISMYREALSLRSGSHPYYSEVLSSLAVAKLRLFDSSGLVEDLTEAILLSEQALSLIVPPHPQRLGVLRNLANGHFLLFKQDGNNANIDKAVYYYEIAARYESGSLIERLVCSQDWAHRTSEYHSNSALNAHRYTIGLLPQLVSVELTLEQRQTVLTRTRTVVSWATECAINEKQFETAVTFMSTGRTVFWSQALQLRTSVDRLALTNPDLANKYITISEQLERASHRDVGPQLATSFHLPTFTSLHGLAEQRNTVIQAVRNIPGFEDFLLPPSFQSLQSAASEGPIVFLTSTESASDALILLSSGSIQHVPLLEINTHMLTALAQLTQILLGQELRSADLPATLKILQTFIPRDMISSSSTGLEQQGFRAALGLLWTSVVQPVIVALGIEKTDSPKRIWWCPTGLFASLPIHAEGIYAETDERKPIDCLFQYAVSSYCISPQDLLHPSPQISHDFQMTAIFEPEALDSTPLPGTYDELGHIKKYMPKQVGSLLVRLGLRDAPNDIDELLAAIQQSSIVHFGCHGTQNLQNPLKSCLLLSGGRLTISKLIKDCKVPNGALAYLGACETARGDDAKPDEWLNLVATMMFAGFRSVVGTLWSIIDDDAPIVAEVFYRHLFRNGEATPPDVRDAAYGLHLGTMELRKQGRPFSSWVPYVHYGI